MWISDIQEKKNLQLGLSQCSYSNVHTYMYSTSIEKTAWQTHDGGVSPMITQHDSLILPGGML